MTKRRVDLTLDVGIGGVGRPMSTYVRREVSVTSSGVWGGHHLRWAVEVLGPERTSSPGRPPSRFTPDGGARRFLETAELSETDRSVIKHGDCDPPLAGIRRG